ncbi:tRNA-binding protein [Candidatus Roizmanbacteria bacterium RIFCSPHIGHO2_01_FULL_39_24]|uniref:tRNA-binding protein n=1 Tax=Candidatus Roizmanbacteria bacterium RIFCSPHIGHO2_01_FULL_39_24 TaxID=1802032 RepID=A0A1F7GET7_9BACT|nr:MAG: tRNA-binding protein [Candidatus Roizmanbacteria bacterium RIFCSPHIGHO2_01_FULL_39_24]
MATIEDFNKLDIRVGKIVEVEDYPGARKPSYKMKIDFGPEIGVKKSIGQFTHYKKEELKGRLVAGVVNFPPFQMGPAVSEVLTLGFPDEEGKAILVVPDRDVPLGGKLF